MQIVLWDVGTLACYKNVTYQHNNVPTFTQCKDDIYYECIFCRHTNVPLYHRTLVYYKKKRSLISYNTYREICVIQFCIQNTYSATYIGFIMILNDIHIYVVSKF